MKKEGTKREDQALGKWILEENETKNG